MGVLYVVVVVVVCILKLALVWYWYVEREERKVEERRFAEDMRNTAAGQSQPPMVLASTVPGVNLVLQPGSLVSPSGQVAARVLTVRVADAPRTGDVTSAGDVSSAKTARTAPLQPVTVEGMAPPYLAPEAPPPVYREAVAASGSGASG